MFALPVMGSDAQIFIAVGLSFNRAFTVTVPAWMVMRWVTTRSSQIAGGGAATAEASPALPTLNQFTRGLGEDLTATGADHHSVLELCHQAQVASADLHLDGEHRPLSQEGVIARP